MKKRAFTNRSSFLLRTLFLVVLFSLCFTVSAKAQTDKKKPTISVSLNTEEPTSQPVKLTLKVSDASGIKEVKYQAGERTASYFKTKGKALTLKNNQRTITVTQNKTYTFYAKDKAGNVRVKTVTINNIDLVPPKLSVETPSAVYTNKNYTLRLQAADTESGVAQVKYLSGKKTATDFIKSGKEIQLDESGNGKVSVSQNGTYTFYAKDKAGLETVLYSKVSVIDKALPLIAPTYMVKQQKASVEVNSSDASSGISSVKYLGGEIADINDEKWETAEDITGKDSFTATKEGVYSILASDKAGNKLLDYIDINMEFKAAWFTYIEYAPSYKYTSYTYSAFTKKVDDWLDKCVAMNMNAVIMQVRPASDALYQSDYYPWSGYIAGTQGKDPGFDPMQYMLDEAHKRGLEFHAYLNPYRVCINASDIKLLSDDNPAIIWMNDGNKETNRYVLNFGGKYYYNPAVPEVQQLIINGVREIVEKYDVDGIHFDDYFYPTLGTANLNKFDYPEYQAYKASFQSVNGSQPLSLANWRRENINSMVKGVYAAIKEVNPSVVFGISPAGNIANLKSDLQYYVDIERWLSEDGYLDYICPQLYWGFEGTSTGLCKFKEITQSWIKITKNSNVNLYVGLAVHNAEAQPTKEWKENTDILKKQVEYLRTTNFTDGIFLYRYEFLDTPKRTKNSHLDKEVTNLINILK